MSRKAGGNSRWIGGMVVTVLVAVVVVGVVIATASSGRPLVSVYPLASTTTALPGTQITFRGVATGELGKIVVTGSQSGRHAGVIRADSDGDGASFLPSHPFRPGERVEVETHLRLVAGHHGRYSFTVAHPASAIPPAALPVSQGTSASVAHFRSRTDLEPATMTVTRDTAPAVEGDVFVAPQDGPYQDGPMILDPSGQLVWFKPFPVSERLLITDFRVQRYLGRPVLTWWQGYTNHGSGRGVGVIYNDRYQKIATVHAGNGLQADLHEFLVTSKGDAYVTAVSPVKLPGIAKPVMDSVVQEIDIRTGLVLFSWHALDHIPLSQSYFTPKSPGQVFDPYHVNSIWPARNGNLIVSMRNTYAIYEINRRTGRIIWRLGGKDSSFKMGPGTRTAMQHDAVEHADGKLTIFDDGAGPPKVHDQSRGVLIALNMKRMSARLVHQYVHSPSTLADFEGSVQRLRDGDVVLGWGQKPYVSESNRSGAQIYSAQFTSPNSSYRAYRYPWTGHPTTVPAVAATESATATAVSVSWNGATDVRRWRVLAGSDAGKLRAVAVADKHDFETTIAVPREPYVRVQALDASGRVIGTSALTQAR